MRQPLVHRPSSRSEGGSARPAARPAPARQAAAGRGHALSDLRIGPRREAGKTVSEPAAAPAPPVALPGSTGAVQRVSFKWKKRLAGLGAIGGGVAAGLGAAALLGAGVALAPLTAAALAGGGALGLLAGGGYLLHRHLKKTPEQRGLEAERKRLAGSRPGSRQELLHDIIGEGLGQLENESTISPESSGHHGGGSTQRVGHQRGRYLVRLSAEEKDPVLRQGYLLHELIHASADTSYAANRREDKEFYNVHDPDDPRGEQHEAYERRITGLDATAQRDDALSDQQREHIQKRLGYLYLDRFREFDTVATDLLHYAHTQGIAEDSPTHQEIVNWAREAYQRRQAARRG